MKLINKQVVTLTPTAPFHFNSTFHKPDHFQSGDNDWKPGTKWQTWNWYGECLGLKFEDKGTVEKPKINLSIYSQKPLSKDRVLSPIIKNWRGMRPGHAGSMYEYLFIGIVLQNTTVKRSIYMLQTLFENYGSKVEFDGKKLWCFWSPGNLKNVPEEDLRALKMGYRAKSMKMVDDQFAQGLINEIELRKKDRETQMKELLSLYGVGPATVWYLLFDIFHHFDFFNHISPWEQKIYSKIFFDKDPENPVPVKKLMKHFETYTPYQQLAVHYIWEDLWWKRKSESLPWLEKLIRV